MSLVQRVRQSLGQTLGLTERRQHPRSDTPTLTLKVEGRKYRALDWSLGGCRIHAAAGAFAAKQRVEGRITVEGADGRGNFVAEVVRLTPDGDVGLRWLELSPHIFVAMGPGGGL